jgi:hypothetical protein
MDLPGVFPDETVGCLDYALRRTVILFQFEKAG